MIYYPILKLKDAGVDSILLISGRGHAGHFLELLGSGSELGVKLAYEVQEEAGGIAQALQLAKEFVGDQKFVVMLGDNVFMDDLNEAFKAFEQDSNDIHLFLKELSQPESYGVPVFEGDKIVQILEKPKPAPSPYAVTGCYLYTPEVFDIINQIKPSNRGELEISDVNDYYVRNGKVSYTILQDFWGDCGESVDAMMQVSNYIQTKMKQP